MKPVSIVVITLVLVAVVVVGVIVFALGGRNKAIAAMTAQAPATIAGTQDVTNNSDGGSNQSEFDVTYVFTAGSQQYTAVASFESKDDYQSAFPSGSKTCYDPADPSQSALVPPDFVCGKSSSGAVIGTAKS
jgi:hypothetical protein